MKQHWKKQMVWLYKFVMYGMEEWTQSKLTWNGKELKQQNNFDKTKEKWNL